MRQIKIGNITLKNPLFLSPMMDVTDLAFRLICRKAGAAMAYTEMLYINKILHANEKIKRLMKTSREDRPIGLQVTGNSARDFPKIIPYLNAYDLIDINCGCPSEKLIGSKSGSFLLKTPNKIAEMVRVLKSSGKPVTVKVRLGFKKNKILEIAKKIEKAGADALTVHARLAVQGNDVEADWKWIAKVKKELGIPVIGNGDIFSGKDVAKMLEFADGAMIGRGALGDPLIFSRALHYLRTGKEQEFDFHKNLKLLKEYLRLVRKHKLIDMGRVKYVYVGFIRRIEGAAKLREQLMRIKSFDGIEDFVKGIK